MEEEDTELEEGEAKEPCDPDKDFSYIDQKLDRLLGDQQKEFQGCTISTEKLGSKFGGYGTFLPTQARAPSMLANPLRPSHVLEPTDSNKEVMELLPFLFYMVFSLAKREADKAMLAGDEPLPQQPLPNKKKNSVSSNDPVVTKKVMIRFKMGKGAGKEVNPKVIQNGLSLSYLSSTSLEDDDKHNLSDAELSPEPSPRSMIQIMMSYDTPRGLLSPLPPSFLEYLDYKETAPIRLKVNKRSKAPLSVRIRGVKEDPDGGKGRKIKANEREKQTGGGIEKKKVCEAVVVDARKKAGRDSDAVKQIHNEPVPLKGSAKAVRNDASNGEEREASIVKVVKGPSKEDIESDKELMTKSSHGKQMDLKVEHSGIISKEKDRSWKLSTVQDKDNEETSRAKEIVKQQAHKNQEAAKLIASEKDSNYKIGILTDGWKQGKDENKEVPISKANAVLKKVKKESQKKNSQADFTARDGNKEGGKTAAKGEWAPKNEPSNVAGQKDLRKDKKHLKFVKDRKVGKKQRDRGQGPLLEAMTKAGRDEKLPGRMDTSAAAVVATDPVVMPAQLVLDNWVQCDKCETWRLLLPGIDTPDSSAKWNCKMMVWMPGMNNCKFTEEETTAAVYSYLGLQNPKLAPTTGAVAELPPPSTTVMEPVSKKSAFQVEIKKSSMVTAGKKGLVDSVVMGAVKLREKEKNKCQRASGGFCSPLLSLHFVVDLEQDFPPSLCRSSPSPQVPKKIQLVPGRVQKDNSMQKLLCSEKNVVNGGKHIQGSTLKHLKGGPNADILEGEETLHTEGNRVGRERNEAEAQALTSVSVKRKKQLEIADEGNEIQIVKKSKGNNNRVIGNDTCVEEYVKVGEHVSYSQRGKPGADVKKAKDTHYSRHTDIDTENIVSVLKDYMSSPGFHESGESEKGQDKKENGRTTDGKRRSKLDFTKVRELNNKRLKKEHERESEDLEGKRPKQDVHRHTHLESKGHVMRTPLPSEQEPEILELGATSSAVAAPLNVIRSKNKGFNKAEVLNHSTPSKICPSPELSGIGSKAHGSPIESTVSSSPVQFRKGERECLSDQKGGWEKISVPNEGVVQQHFCAGESPKHGEHASHHSSGDEGEFYHAAATWNGAVAFQKQDYSHGAYRHPSKCSPRDDWGRPSSQESHLDKTGGSSWCDGQPEHGEDVPIEDETHPVVSEHGARDYPLGNKGSSWKGERAAPVSRKESDSAMLHTLDTTTVPRRTPSAKAIVQVKEGTEEALKQECQPGQSKALMNSGRDGEGATSSSPIKKEHSHARNPAFSAAQSEGKALKHSADRLKNQPGLEIESTNLYLLAALKFLQAASIVENDNTESNRARETQSMMVYNDTATLCKYCADRYERSHNMAAAALAYTCAAVALGRRMLCKNSCFASDCSELYTAVQQMPGESPSSSSASDVDNLNNHSLGPSDKSTMAQMLGRAATASPHTMAGPAAAAMAAPSSHIIVPPRLHSSFTRFLKDATDMSNLLEAWQKASIVTAKAEVTCDQKGMLAVKRVGELGGFGDIETVVHLVRVAMDTIGH
ncbi:unnamed protein product [Sphagnum troendelagicum]|uniref:CW-type domain-containing protein n=1 Tax=Sphagnum troendelagicum TaxID=128251 RepID=A0ABP0TPP6_9BRYO